jgi:hypothetical protein
MTAPRHVERGLGLLPRRSSLMKFSSNDLIVEVEGPPQSILPFESLKTSLQFISTTNDSRILQTSQLPRQCFNSPDFFLLGSCSISKPGCRRSRNEIACALAPEGQSRLQNTSTRSQNIGCFQFVVVLLVLCFMFIFCNGDGVSDTVVRPFSRDDETEGRLGESVRIRERS